VNYDQSRHNFIDGETRTAHHDNRSEVEVEQHENEELSVFVPDAVVYPRTVMIHIHDASTANRAVMASLWLIHIAAITESLTPWILTFVSLHSSDAARLCGLPNSSARDLNQSTKSPRTTRGTLHRRNGISPVE
jgi:hypothetical protein